MRPLLANVSVTEFLTHFIIELAAPTQLTCPALRDYHLFRSTTAYSVYPQLTSISRSHNTIRHPVATPNNRAGSYHTLVRIK